MYGVVLLHLLSIFSTKSSLKLSDSSTIITSPVLYSLSHCRLAADLPILYRYFYGHCSMEIRGISPDPMRRVCTNGSSTHAHPFQVTLPNPRLIAHNHPSFQELLNYGTHSHPLFPPNSATYHLSNPTSTNLILTPYLLKLSSFS